MSIRAIRGSHFRPSLRSRQLRTDQTSAIPLLLHSFVKKQRPLLPLASIVTPRSTIHPPRFQVLPNDSHRFGTSLIQISAPVHSLRFPHPSSPLRPSRNAQSAKPMPSHHRPFPCQKTARRLLPALSNTLHRYPPFLTPATSSSDALRYKPPAIPLLLHSFAKKQPPFTTPPLIPFRVFRVFRVFRRHSNLKSLRRARSAPRKA